MKYCFVRLMILCVGFTFTMLAVLSPRHAAAKEDTCIPGTYLVEQEDGTQSLWTLAKHGDLHITSSAEAEFPFSHEQGVWKPSGMNTAKAMTLDFTFGAPVNGGVPPAAIARVDALLTFSEQCQRGEGSFELRFFDPQTEDALEPTTDTGDVVTMRFTGRRLMID
jgi:hypothetical protein